VILLRKPLASDAKVSGSAAEFKAFAAKVNGSAAEFNDSNTEFSGFCFGMTGFRISIQ
jgi:hypothetical protein